MTGRAGGASIGTAALVAASLLGFAPAASAASIPRPTVTQVSPRHGSTVGGIRITLHGTGFRHVTRVYFGGRAGHHLSIASGHTLRVTTPLHPPGRYRVRVRSDAGMSPYDGAIRFRFHSPLVVVDPGHNGGNASHPGIINRLVPAGYGRTKPCNTTGTATNGGYPEHAFNWNVAQRLQILLHQHFVRVHLTRPDDHGVGPCVNVRARRESARGVVAAVAIHADGAPSWGHGFHVNEDSRRPVGASLATVHRSTRLGIALHDALKRSSGLTPSNYIGHHGYVRRDDLAGLNLSTKPTSFLELGNMRNAGDARRQHSAQGRQRIAHAIGSGLITYLREFARSRATQSAATPTSARDVPVPRAATEAVRYAREHHMSAGIAVLDTRAGALYSAGRSRRAYAGASVVKTLIATRLLLAGQMHGHVARLAWRMITRSDNAAAWTLYPKVGRDRLLPWISRHYGITWLGTRPTMPGIWGSTQLTARGLVRFYAAVRRDPTVWPWLSRAMHAYRRLSSSGEPNAFGIAAAAPRSAVKNGWDVDRDVKAPSNAIINSTGLVDRDRFAVAILAEGPGRLYYRPGERIVTSAARLLMPGGRITPLSPPAVHGLSPRSGPASGGTWITVSGTGFRHVESVRFGAQPVHRFRVLSRHRMRVRAPAHRSGRVQVRVLGRYGASRRHDADRFRYS